MQTQTKSITGPTTCAFRVIPSNHTRGSTTRTRSPRLPAGPCARSTGKPMPLMPGLIIRLVSARCGHQLSGGTPLYDLPQGQQCPSCARWSPMTKPRAGQ